MTESKFENPATQLEAHNRLNVLNTEIRDIHEQIKDADEDVDEDWLRRAKFARRIRRQEKAFLVRWIQKDKDLKAAIAASRGNLNLAEHLKSHRKLMTELYNLLLAVEEHLEKDDEDTWESLKMTVDRIRAIS